MNDISFLNFHTEGGISMGAMDLLKSEFRKLTENRALLLAVIGVLLIPIIYVAILLSAKWGPYDNMDNLPVAVVNNDVGATSDGKPINVGKDLVATLEASKTLGWKFVTTEEANKGLKNNDYYMVITIPEDFSQKVTTVLDDNPQVPEIVYTKNEGMNFMASQVTNSAVERVREQLGDKITATFATTVFNRFPDIAAGFTAGAEGSQQIFDGTVKLQDGTKQIISNMEVKKPDIARLAAGAKEADQGVTTLLNSVVGGTSSINQLNSGAHQIANGVQTVEDKTAEVAAGATTIAAGMNTVSTNLQAIGVGGQSLIDGAGQISGGASQLNAGATQYAAGIDSLNQNLVTFRDGVVANNQLVDGVKTVNGGLVQIQQGLAAAPQLAAGFDQLATPIANLNTGAAGILTGLQGLNEQVAAAAPTAEALSKKIAAGQQLTAEELGAVAKILGSVPVIANGTKELTTGMTSVSGGLTQLNGSVNEGTQSLKAGVTAISTGLVGGINQLVAATNGQPDGELDGNGQRDLQLGAQASKTQIAGYINQFIAATNGQPDGEADGNGQRDLRLGINQIATGAKALSDNTASTSQFSSGVRQLGGGAVQIAAATNGKLDPGEKADLQLGAKTLASGANLLSKTVGAQLTPGARELAAGTDTLVGSWGTLASGVQRLKAGTAQIADGNQTVATGWDTIIDGVTQVDDGVVQLNEGSKELQTGLAGGAEEVSAVSPNEANINMFATPVNVVGENANAYEYYRDSTAPYILSLALFVSMLILSFFTDFKQPVGDPRSAFSWYFSKWLKLAIFAVVQAIILALFVLLILGLSVTSIPLFLLFTLFVSLTFMSIVFFLVAVGGNIGRFIALAFLVLQLSITGANLPIDMLPQFHRNLSSVLPLTYSNGGFKAIISLGDTNMLVSNVGVLAIYFVGASLLALIAFVIAFKSGKAQNAQNLASETQV